MKISISNLNRSASTQNLRDLFSPFGDVVSVTLILDRSTGRSRGAAQVEMRDKACGERAIAALNQKSFMSSMINVREVAESANAFSSSY